MDEAEELFQQSLKIEETPFAKKALEMIKDYTTARFGHTRKNG